MSRRMSGARCPASLHKPMSSGFSERPRVKYKVETEKTKSRLNLLVSNTDCVSPKSDETGKDPSASTFLLLKGISVNVKESLFAPLKMYS